MSVRLGQARILVCGHDAKRIEFSATAFGQKSTLAALSAPGFSRSPRGGYIRQSVQDVLKEKTGARFRSHPFWDTHCVFTGGPFMHDFVGQFPVLVAFSERTEKQRNAPICIFSKERVTSCPLLRIMFDD